MNDPSIKRYLSFIYILSLINLVLVYFYSQLTHSLGMPVSVRPDFYDVAYPFSAFLYQMLMAGCSIVVLYKIFKATFNSKIRKLIVTIVTILPLLLSVYLGALALSSTYFYFTQYLDRDSWTPNLNGPSNIPLNINYL